MLGWYVSNWWMGDDPYLIEEYGCTAENRKQVVQYTLTIVQNEFLKNYSKVIDSGIVSTSICIKLCWCSLSSEHCYKTWWNAPNYV